MDVDIVVNWNLGTLRKTEAALTALGLVSRLPISAEDVFRFRDEYVSKRRLIAWNFTEMTTIQYLRAVMAHVVSME